jgi:DNA helicase II / ATP-dependent DNA helicase PcrA
VSSADDDFDAEADATIQGCINLEKPRSFFLYAGAGSGKTRSLVNAIRVVCFEQGRRLSLSGQKIGVITYTNAACEEIQQRLEFDHRVQVSTIHAFAWSLISGYDSDIRKWVAARLIEEIEELEVAQGKGRAGTKAAAERAKAIDSKRRRHGRLDQVTRFIYSPTGENRTRDSLNHAEVIAITTDFLNSRPALQRLLISRFPVLLIDESQDTNRNLIDALLRVEEAYRSVFCLGLFGDMMQRIYADGKDRLAEEIPASWARPRKRMNHRCPTRVVEIINAIRQDVDGERQVPRSDAPMGTVRLFVASQDIADKSAAEGKMAAAMAWITADEKWADGAGSVKTLALEHAMAARRFGFQQFFEPLYAVDRIRTSLLQGTGAAFDLFTREILPLVDALRAEDRFQIAAIVRRTSPLLEREALESAGADQATLLKKSKDACDSLLAMIVSPNRPSAGDILRHVAATNLFTVPDSLLPYVGPVSDPAQDSEGDPPGGEAAELTAEIGAWAQALGAPFEEIERYDAYVRGVSPFDTHQGVKGLEFPRVMVIVSDEEARGFMFSYDKLFGSKEKTKSDLDNEASGKETTIDRTRRLFYVTCSRAEESLAVVYYAAEPAAARDALIAQGWFTPDEIVVFA